MNKARILYLSYDGLGDPLGESQVTSYVRGLSERDWDFYIVSFEKSDHGGINDTSLGSNIKWHPLVYHRRPPIVSTIYDVIKLRRLAGELVGSKNIEVVHCRGYVTGLVGLWLKRRFGIKLIFDMRGFWPDEKLESGHWANPIYQPVYRYFKKRERELFENADHVISLTNVGARYINKFYNVGEERLSVIPTCVDDKIFFHPSRERKKEMKANIGVEKNDHVFVYSGSLGGNYPVDRLLDLFDKNAVKYRNPILIVVSKQVSLLPHRDDILSLNSSYREIATYLLAADTGLIFYMPGFSNIGRCPTKYAEYLACGLHIIAPDDYGDMSYYRELADPLSFFSLANGIDKYQRVYNSLARQRPALQEQRSTTLPGVSQN